MKVAALLAILATSPLAAQVPAGAAPGVEHATLHGVVVDSVRGGFLKGASVGVVGPSRMALTDSLGRFSIDNIPPGEYRVALFDALLDSLAISVVSAPTRFSAGDTVELILAIPSQATIIAAKCGAPANEEESSALFGTVLRAEDGTSVAGAEVRVEWLEVVIDEATGVRGVPRSSRARADSAGRYKVCGLPSGLNAEITARRGEDSTASVPMIYGNSRLGIANLFIAGPAAGGRRAVGAQVRGIVVDASGKPVGNAMVALSSSPAAVTTESNGRFEIAGQRFGTQSVLVRRLGYQPVEVVVNVTPQPSAPLTVTLDELVPIIESVVIEARHNAALERVGFARRKHYGLGRYYEAKDLEHVTNLENFFKTIPVLNRRTGLPMAQASPGRFQDIIDVREMGPGGSNNTNARRAPPKASEGSAGGESGTCRATYVDGVRVSETDFLMPNEVAAIEVYSPTMTPSEFRAYATCATVLIWTDWKLRRAQIRR